MLDTNWSESRLRAGAHRYARWAGPAVGAMAAQQLVTMDTSRTGDDYGMPLVFAITAFGLCVVGGVLLADALTPRPREAVRTAGLAPRRVRDHVPPRVTPLLLLQAVSVVVLLVIGAATASPDALGRAGRALTVTCDGAAKSFGSWPGLFYGIPILASLTIGTAVCAWALRRIALRPGTDQQRRDRSWAVTAAWGVLVSSQLLLVVLMIAVVLTHTTCAGTLGTISALVIYPLGLLALSTLAWSLFTVVVPRAARR